MKGIKYFVFNTVQNLKNKIIGNYLHFLNENNNFKNVIYFLWKCHCLQTKK